MKSLFEPQAVVAVKDRLARLRPDAQRQWGKMTVAQMVSHCATSMELATGDLKPPRVFIGRILGPLVKPLALGNDRPMQRNSPTSPELIVRDERDFAGERARLNALIDRFVEGGREECTTHPHSFFGRLTPDEWAELMYKHLDHHLRQFGT